MKVLYIVFIWINHLIEMYITILRLRAVIADETEYNVIIAKKNVYIIVFI